MIVMTPEETAALVRLLSANEILRPLLSNVAPDSVNRNPWDSNYAAVTCHQDPEFCRTISEAIRAPGRMPKSVAIMRSLADPDEIIDPFHDIHIDSRISDKTLIVLCGSGSYTIFTDTVWDDFSFVERLELLCRQALAQLIEIVKLRSLQFRFTHALPNRLARKAYTGRFYRALPGTVIKFNNMLPHHSHRRPTEFSLMLQVVYT